MMSPEQQFEIGVLENRGFYSVSCRKSTLQILCINTVHIHYRKEQRPEAQVPDRGIS